MATLAKIPDTQQAREFELDKLYWRDSYTWAMQQAAALRRRNFAAVDWKNVIEEIEDVAKSEERSLKSQYARAVAHLLKLEYRREGESRFVAGWRTSVNDARAEIKDVLRDNPGLKGHRDEIFAKAWRKGKEASVNAFVDYDTQKIQDDSIHFREQKRLKREWDETLPRECPYTREQVEGSDWMPQRNPIAQRPQKGRQHGHERPFD